MSKSDVVFLSPLAQYFPDYHLVTIPPPASLANLPQPSDNPISNPLHMYDRHSRSSARRWCFIIRRFTALPTARCHIITVLSFMPRSPFLYFLV